jgi:hypothetical protein
LIERFHYTLKSGCKIEQLQLETQARLLNLLATYSIVAWRLIHLTYCTRLIQKRLVKLCSHLPSGNSCGESLNQKIGLNSHQIYIKQLVGLPGWAASSLGNMMANLDSKPFGEVLGYSIIYLKVRS